jgi:hypothetical protein
MNDLKALILKGIDANQIIDRYAGRADRGLRCAPMAHLHQFVRTLCRRALRAAITVGQNLALALNVTGACNSVPQLA